MIIRNLLDHINSQPDRFGRSVVITNENSVLFLYTFEPGQAMTEHTHPFANELLTVIEGEAVISVGTESVMAHPQQVIFAPKEEVHAIFNHSKKRLLVASFMSPKP